MLVLNPQLKAQALQSALMQFSNCIIDINIILTRCALKLGLEFPFELTKAKGWRTFVEREHSTHHTVSVWSVKH